MTPFEVARAEIRVKIVLLVQALKQACQTGGPIACSMRQAITFLLFLWLITTVNLINLLSFLTLKNCEEGLISNTGISKTRTKLLQKFGTNTKNSHLTGIICYTAPSSVPNKISVLKCLFLRQSYSRLNSTLPFSRLKCIRERNFELFIFGNWEHHIQD